MKGEITLYNKHGTIIRIASYSCREARKKEIASWDHLFGKKKVSECYYQISPIIIDSNKVHDNGTNSGRCFYKRRRRLKPTVIQ